MTVALLAAALSTLVAPELSVGGDYLLDPADDGQSGRVFQHSAARGEFLVVPIRIENDGLERTLDSCEMLWQSGNTPEQTWWRSASPGDFLAGEPIVPDGCIPLEEATLPAGETLEVLLVLRVAVDAAPGLRKGKVHARFSEGDGVRATLSLKVYDFHLSARPSLPALFPLDVGGISKRWTIPTDDVDSWTALYDHLSVLGVGLRLSFSADDEATNGDSALQAHWNYLAATSRAPLIDVGGVPGRLVSELGRPTALVPQDPLQTLLFESLGGLRVDLAQVVPVAQPLEFAARDRWHLIRQEYARFARADGRVKRILASPLHPHFERYADIWALPESASTVLLGHLASGRSLIRYDQGALSHCVGSEGRLDAHGRYQTLASEAVDGSEATAWLPEPSVGGHMPWIEVTFRDHYLVETMTILGDLDPASFPVVESAYNPNEYARATVTWERAKRDSEASSPVWVGTFRHPRACHAVRIHLPSLNRATLGRLVEVLFNNESLDTLDSAIPSVSPWLDSSSAGDLAWRVEDNGASYGPRQLGWRCWARGFHGVLGPSLQGNSGPSIPLLGPGTRRPIVTRRLFALRDGLEDYEYLRIYWDRVSEKALERTNDFFPGIGGEVYADSSEGHRARRDTRDRIGRLLSGEATLRKNFGPRRSGS